MGKFSVDSRAVAPSIDLTNFPWAPADIAADIQLSEWDYRKLQHFNPKEQGDLSIEVDISGAGLEAIGKAISTANAGLVGGAGSKVEFELRVLGFVGISRKVYLKDVRYISPDKWAARFGRVFRAEDSTSYWK